MANLGDDTISQYDALPGGALRPSRPDRSTVRPAPSASRSRPAADSLYVAGFGAAAVGQYDVGSDGALSAKTPPSVGAGFRPIAVVAVKPRDVQAPTIDLRTPPDGAQYTLGEDVAADYSCADEGGSGLASCTGDVPDGDPLSTTTAGDHAFTVVARDGAGNETTVTHHYTVVAAPDEQAPTVDLRTPSQGAQYDVGADVRRGLLVCRRGRLGAGVVHRRRARRRPAETPRRRAPTDFTVVARDGAGHETTVTNSYTVVEPPPPPDLGFEGFFGPIHDGSVVRAGDAIRSSSALDAYHGLTPGRRLAQQRAGRLPASRARDGWRAGPQRVRSGPALQPPDRPLRLHVADQDGVGGDLPHLRPQPRTTAASSA